MKRSIILVVAFAVLLPCLLSASTRCWFKGQGWQRFLDGTNQDTIHVMAPVTFYDEFLGFSLEVEETGDTTGRWETVETALNTGIALVADGVNGEVDIILDNDDNTSLGCLYWGDQQSLSMRQGLNWEARVCFPVLPLTGSETVSAVFGVAAAHNTTPDDIVSHAWFRVESAANTALLWEIDDANTDDDDNDADTVLVASTYNVFRIECISTTTVKFYVDGVVVGTGTWGGLSAAEAKVQPYFCMTKIKASENTGTGTMRIDYCRCWQSRGE